MSLIRDAPDFEEDLATLADRAAAVGVVLRKRSCFRCAGRGYVFVWDGSEHTEPPCRQCSGTGKIDDRRPEMLILAVVQWANPSTDDTDIARAFLRVPVLAADGDIGRTPRL